VHYHYPPEDAQYKIHGIAMVKNMASAIDYHRQLGFNTTTLTFITNGSNDISDDLALDKKDVFR
jgi:hypothetical protein